MRHSRRHRGRRAPALRAGLLCIAAPTVALASVLTAGAHFPRLPRIGVAGSLVWPTYIGPGLLSGLGGTVAALSARRLGSRRLGGWLAFAGSLATAASVPIFVEQLRAAREAGAPVRPAIFAVRPSPKVRPDARVEYGQAPDGQILHMDVYLPAESGVRPAPLMMYVHGGGWIQGSPDDASADLRWFADQGYVVVAPEYSLATEARPTWDIAAHQVGEALAWAVKRADRWGADGERIALWGASAGANLALLVSYAAADGSLVRADGTSVPRVSAVAGEVPAVDPLTVYNNRDAQWGAATRSMVQTYIGGAAKDLPDRIRAVRVNSYLSASAPPTLLTVCVADHLVPVEGVRTFVEQAKAAGVDITAAYRRWGDHLISVRYDGLPNQTMLHLYLRHFRRHGA